MFKILCVDAAKNNISLNFKKNSYIKLIVDMYFLLYAEDELKL